MAKDGCMGIVDSATVSVHPRRSDYIAEMGRMAEEMKQTPNKPDMRMAGCYGFNACPFVCVCHGSGEPRPESYGFKLA
jgi:hypothetical protein